MKLPIEQCLNLEEEPLGCLFTPYAVDKNGARWWRPQAHDLKAVYMAHAARQGGIRQRVSMLAQQTDSCQSSGSWAGDRAGLPTPSPPVSTLGPREGAWDKQGPRAVTPASLHLRFLSALPSPTHPTWISSREKQWQRGRDARPRCWGNAVNEWWTAESKTDLWALDYPPRGSLGCPGPSKHLLTWLYHNTSGSLLSVAPGCFKGRDPVVFGLWVHPDMEPQARWLKTTELYALTVPEGRRLKSSCLQGHAPSKSSKGGSILASSSFQGPQCALACGCPMPVPVSALTWPSLSVHAHIALCLEGHQPSWIPGPA